jgi:hypothetical protein
MKRLVFLAVGLALLGSTPASAWTWGHSKKQTYGPKIIKKLDDKKDSWEGQPSVTAPIPEPTAALVFGTSLLVIGLSKRRRSDR